MESLLKEYFINHYQLHVCEVPVKKVTTSNASFGLIDRDNLVCDQCDGEAKYDNPNKKQVSIVNFEPFFKSLPKSFIQGYDNCDLIVYTSDRSCFLLNELTHVTTRKVAKYNHAIEQLQTTLKFIYKVFTIKEFIESHKIKQCCFFSKEPLPPDQKITAINSFNRLGDAINNSPNTLFADYGFDFKVYSGKQIYQL